MVRLQDYGFLLPKSVEVHTEDAAAEAASRIGFPVVLKVVSPDIVHKTEVGGVVTDVRSTDQVRRSYQGILESVRMKASKADIRSVEVAEMCRVGVEIIIGLHRDDQFGPVIMFGLGGVYAQLFRDVSFRLLPIVEEDASAMIGEIKGQELLHGFRGQTPVSHEALVDLLMRANRAGIDLADQLGSVDLNPIVL